LWLVETSADDEGWRDVAREEDNKQLSGAFRTGTFPFAGGGECRLIRLVNTDRTHFGNGVLRIYGWEVFGSLLK
jgi:hypothetical protein